MAKDLLDFLNSPLLNEVYAETFLGKSSVNGWQKLFFLYKCFQPTSAAVAMAAFEIYDSKFSG